MPIAVRCAAVRSFNLVFYCAGGNRHLAYFDNVSAYSGFRLSRMSSK